MGIFCSAFFQKDFTDLKTILYFTKFELFTTFRSQNITGEVLPWKDFFSLDIFPGLPTTNKISKSHFMFESLNVSYDHSCFTSQYSTNQLSTIQSSITILAKWQD